MAEYTTRAEISALGTIDPEFAALMQSMASNPAPPQPADPKERMAALRATMVASEATLNATFGPSGPDVHESYQEILASTGDRKIPLRITRPAATTPASRPLVVLFFGGGFVSGTYEQDAAVSRILARLFGAVSVAPSYRLAPEHPFPAGVQDCWETVRWAAEHASTLGADPRAGFVVGGASAGGNFAAVCATLARDEGLPGGAKITGVHLQVPMTMNESIVPDKYREVYFSREQNSPPGLNKAALEGLVAAYAADDKSRLFSPFNSPSGVVGKGMPRTYLQVDGMDRLRDDGMVYERELRESGVPTKMDVYPGLPHASYFTFPTQLSSSRKAHLDTVRGFAWLLEKTVGEEELEKAMAFAPINT